jgi:hypothetical protein
MQLLSQIINLQKLDSEELQTLKIRYRRQKLNGNHKPVNMEIQTKLVSLPFQLYL